MNILILAAGSTPSNPQEPSYPTWLTEVDGELLLERQIEGLRQLGPRKFIFVFRRHEAEAFHLADIAGQMAPGSAVVLTSRDTAGAACSAMLAIGKIDMDSELTVANATDQIDMDFRLAVEAFRRARADAGVLTFSSLHPRYSYVRTDSDGFVIESSEKRPISRTANAGFYWFKRARDFFESLQTMILKDTHVQDKFYICPALNEMVLKQKRIATYGIAFDQYHPLKSTKQVAHLEDYISERGQP